LKTLVADTRSHERRRKAENRWIDNVKEDLHQRGSDVQQAAECAGRNLSVQLHHWQSMGKDEWVKNEEEKDILGFDCMTNKHTSCWYIDQWPCGQVV